MTWPDFCGFSVSGPMFLPVSVAVTLTSFAPANWAPVLRLIK